MPRLTKTGYLIVLAFITIAAVITFIGFLFNPFVAPLMVLIFAALGRAGAFILKPFETSFRDFVEDHIGLSSAECRILVYGLPRSGKTTLVRRLLTYGIPRQEESTEHFDIFEHSVKLELKGPTFEVWFADYKGQKPSQVVGGFQDVRFFGSSEHKLVNVIFFVVDLFPEFPNEKEEPLEYQEFMKKYEKNAEEEIKKRVESNTRYINEFTIEPVLQATYNEKHLFAVRLLINKIDIYKDMIARGYIKGVDTSNAYDTVKKYYEPTIMAIRKACRVNNITNFDVVTISAAEGDRITLVFAEILNSYKERMKKHVGANG